MLPVIFGMSGLLLLLVAVIGGSIAYYTKQDMKFEAAAKGLPDDVRLQYWYNKGF